MGAGAHIEDDEGSSGTLRGGQGSDAHSLAEASSLLHLVRFPAMPPDFLVEHVEPHPRMARPECCGLMLEAFRSQALASVRPQPTSSKHAPHSSCSQPPCDPFRTGETAQNEFRCRQRSANQALPPEARRILGLDGIGGVEITEKSQEGGLVWWPWPRSRALAPTSPTVNETLRPLHSLVSPCPMSESSPNIFDGFHTPPRGVSTPQGAHGHMRSQAADVGGNEEERGTPWTPPPPTLPALELTWKDRANFDI
jgi:hypothetical protein